jgi:hypothetical protein
MDGVVARGNLAREVSFKAPDSMPRALAAAARNAIIEIKACDRREKRTLMHAMQRAAWPTRRAQRQ